MVSQGFVMAGQESMKSKLLQEAKLRLEWAQARFEEWDNPEDMHDVDTWATVVRWLNGELPPVWPRKEWLK